MSMPAAQRDQFLSDVRVAIIAVDEPGRGPLALPIWYEYVDGGIEIGLDAGSRKAELLRAAGRATVTVQDESPPYRYVSVEGPIEITSKQRDVLRVASRYLGPEFGEWYARENPATSSTVVFRLTPEHWRTQDFSAATSATEDRSPEAR
jgi:nitroimidazol reductase NimA-like FMN-containing flavoprotein (pyridoxamine 5'-phosphate oxidase superfamily)